MGISPLFDRESSTWKGASDAVVYLVQAAARSNNHFTAYPYSRRAERLEQQFELLKSNWKRETTFLSDVDEIMDSPSYRAIVELGEDVIPLILKSLQEKPDFWFGALERLTNTDPVAPASYGNIIQMADDWIAWAQANGY